MRVSTKFVRWTSAAILLLAFATFGFAQDANLIGNAGVETRTPFFWQEGETGGTLTWTSTGARTGQMALLIDKSSTGAAASWVSDNQATAYWNNVGAVLYDLTAHVYIPTGASFSATAGERIGIEFTFQDASGVDVVSPQFIAASPDTLDAWQVMTTQVLLSSVPTLVTAEIIIESNATGTATFDDFNISSDPWTMGFFGDGAETPSGWMNWTSPDKIGFANVVEDVDYASTGSYSVKLEETDSNDDEMVFYSEPYSAKASTEYLVGVTATTDNMNTDGNYYPTAPMGDNIADRASLCFFFHAGDIVNGWSPTGGDQFIYLDQRADTTAQTMYWGLVTSPEDATGISVRARFNSTVEGTVHYDDFFAYELIAGSNLLTNGDLETMTPAFWMEGETGGTLEWTGEQAKGGIRSLKIDKASTGTAASWQSVNQATLYWNNVGAVLYDLSANMYVASGASFSGTTAGERIGVVFHFEDGSGADVVAPQFLAALPDTVDAWQVITAQVLLPSTPANVYAEAIVESNATATAYFDQFNISSDPWTMGFFGADAETPSGWMHWTDETKIGFANAVNDTSYGTGNYAVKMEETDTNDDEMVFYSTPVAVSADTWYEFSARVMVDTLYPAGDTLYPSAVIGDHFSDRANLCFFFHSGDIENSWSPTGGDQFVYFDSRADSTGWMNVRGIAQAPGDASGASIRARFNSAVEGKVYYDDFVIREMTMATASVPEAPGDGALSGLPGRASLNQNYPNPFNASTAINFTVPQTGKVTLEVFDVLGRKVSTLVNEVLPAGQHTALFTLSSDLQLSSGVYFYRLRTTEGIITKRMVFLK